VRAKQAGLKTGERISLDRHSAFDNDYRPSLDGAYAKSHQCRARRRDLRARDMGLLPVPA